MTKTDFRADLRRGLGSCPLALDRCPDIEAYRADVLWACRHAVAYDTQSEGTRAIYVYEMLLRFGDPAYFFAPLADGARRDIKDRGWRFAHEADILALMAGDGYVPARQALDELYSLLLAALRAGRPCRSGVWPAADNFGMLCVSVLTNALPSRREEEAFFLRALADHGRLIKQRPALRDCFEDEWFEIVAAERFGQDRLAALLAENESDPDIARYVQNRDRLAAERRAHRARDAAPMLRRPEHPQTADWRDRALARLAGDPRDADALCCLIVNYRPGDGETLIPLIKSLPVYEDRDGWHEVFSDVLKRIAADPAADRELSAVLLPHIYRKGFCSFCRHEAVERMAARGLLTPAMREECRHDCNMEIRAFAETDQENV